MDGPRDDHTSEVSQRERQISYDIAYMWNLKKKKNDTSELTYKIETASQAQKTNLWLPKGKQEWEAGERNKL